MDQQITCTAVIVCEQTQRSENGLFSLIHVLPELQLRLTSEEIKQIGLETKYTQAPLEVVMVLERQEYSAEAGVKIHVEFYDPNGTLLFDDAVSTVRFPQGVKKLYASIKFEKGVPCAVQGNHLFVVRLNKGGGTKDVLRQEPFTIKMFDLNGSLVG